ncbi:MAG TPA: hypothetical protein VMZ22_04095 [Acidimicrobiales bacterium]|nr:hypothetical protein [Acidimicrobiales bacterium]
MSTDRSALDREALRETEAPGELLRRYLAAGGGQALAFVLLGAGALLLIVGWFGVSREVIVSKQIPYLVSGGLGGAFLLGLGALLLVTHELRLDNRRLQAVEMLMEELRDALLLDENAAAAPPGIASNGNGTSPKKFAVVAGGSRYHLATCSAAAGKELTYVGGESLKKQGLQPCRICAPEVA